MKTQSDQLQRDIATAVSMAINAQNEKTDQIKRLGEFLLEKVASYPDFLEEVASANKNISYEWLLLVLKVGRGHVYTPLIHHYQTHGVRRISRFEINQQKQLWNTGVLVAVPTGNGYKEQRKSICNLTHKEVIRVFASSQVRTVEQQITLATKLKTVPLRKYVVNGDKAHMTRCVLDKREVADLAAKILNQDDVIQLLSRSKRAAA